MAQRRPWTARRVVRQTFKTCFWCITIPAVLLVSLLIPVVTLCIWATASDRGPSLGVTFVREVGNYWTTVAPLVIT